MVNPTINQFAMTPVLGQLDLQYQGSVITGQIDSTQVGTVQAGTALKLTTTAGGVPKVVAVAADTDSVFGFACRNLKDAGYIAKSYLEIALATSVMWMVASAAITRGSKVTIDSTNTYVTAYTGTGRTVGYTLDTAANTGDLVRVMIENQSASGIGLRTVNVVATLAEINAGKILIPGVTGQSINVLNYVARVTGAFTTGTAVLLQSTNVSPVLVTTLAEAGLTNGAVLTPASANTTLGAGFATPLGSGDGLKVANSGSNQAGGTSILFSITYDQA